MATCEPVYETLSGWMENVNTFTRHQDLPPDAKAYISRIEEISGVPLRLISVGPERDQIILNE
jgi:adenylosuccinate synthase